MFTTLRNAWSIPELRKKLIFTALIMLLYRIGNVVPVPYINGDALVYYFNQTLSGTILGLYNAMSGSAFSQATVLALSIQPYINASIIIQLLTIAIPALERLQKDGGEEGKKKLNMITRLTTIGLGLLMGWAYYMMLINSGAGIITDDGFLAAVVIILAFTAGSAVVMWLGEQITEHGIGNGISMILFANIISRLPASINDLFVIFFNTEKAPTWWIGVIEVVLSAALIVLIVFVNDAERRIPVQYAKRVVGRKVYGGQNTNLPIKVSMTGVMPVIFASSIASLPATICTFGGWTKGWWYENVFSADSWIYAICYFLLIFFFSWFYASIQYDPVEISNNLKKNGGFIPGFRPGKPTSDFIKKVINKIVIFGAVYLGIVALLPIISGNLINAYVDGLFASTHEVYAAVHAMAIGGTSVIIVVSVALETVKALEAQMLMRHYKGFLD
ncbi:MAG: preprotein translocase subunit SecY [Ruminococcaceae bacterium]|nr:preprotein translocase subunit SecY [Oscillospiraceae bacterium]